MSDEAYMAGFFDGEGCITFQKVSSGKHTVTYSPMVGVSNNNFELMAELQNKFGGKLYKRTPKNPNHSVNWFLSFTSRKLMLEFLERIYPFLKSKKPQAETAIKFLKSRLQKVPVVGGNIKLSSEEIEWMRTVRSLNLASSKKTNPLIER